MHNALSKHQAHAGSRPNPSSNSTTSMLMQVQLQPYLQQLLVQRHRHPQTHCRVHSGVHEEGKGSNNSSSEVRGRSRSRHKPPQLHSSPNQAHRTDEHGLRTAVARQLARGTVVAAAAVLPQPPQHLGFPTLAQPQLGAEQLQQPQQQPQQQQNQQQQNQQSSAPLLQALQPAEQQQQQQQQLINLLPLLQQPQPPKAQRNSSQGLDPSALPITDRVRLLTSNAAARRRINRFRSLPGGVPVNVSTYCAEAGLSAAASNALLQHVRAMRISSAPEALGPFVAAYKRLAGVYGENVVVCWLRKAPPIIRAEDEVSKGCLHAGGGGY